MSEEQATKKQQRRKPFTQGWSESFHVTDSLPIKKGGKVIRTFIPTPTPSKGVQDDQDVVIHDDSDDEEKRLKKEEELENHRKASMRQVKPKLSLEIDINIQNTEAQKLALQQKIANICTLILANPEEAFSHRKKPKNAEDNEEDSDVDEDKEEEKRRKKVNKYENTPEFHIEDLLKLASSKNPYEVELVLLSTAVLFKDVCPSYRIRHVNTETDNSQSNQNNNKAGNPMKKETRQLIQFEKLLVKYYHDFIVLLQKRVEWSFTLQTPSLTTLSLALGIDNSDGDMLQTKEFSLSWKKYDKIRKYLGYIAFKAECELLKSLSSFNYRSLVLSSILQQSMTFYDYYYKYQQKTEKKQQQVLQVTSLSITSFTSSFTGEMIQNIMNECIHCLEYLLLHDIDKDITLEILTVFHRNIKIVKYNISFHLLKIFESLSFHIHMNDKEKIQKMKKINKKQFKKQLQDIDREVEIGLLESNANGNEINKKAFEIQILQEVCLIYFRILKMKIGYHLIPIALEGLGRITHLIDMDTVKDLINLLRGFLFQQEDPNQSQLQQQGTLMNPHTPYEVKLLSLHCILKTLIAYSGKDVLQVDDEPYLLMFKLLLKKLPVPTSASTTIVNNEEGEAEEGVTEASSTNDRKSNKKEKGKERNHLSNHNEFSIYYYWKVILQIIDLLFIQKHDDRNDYVISIIKLLLKELSSQISRHVIPNSLGVSVMTFIHNLILRYPRIRSDLQDIIRQSVETINSSNNNNNNHNNNDDEDGENNDNTTENKKKKKKRKAKDITPALFDEDEKVEDLAMIGLQEYDYHHQNSLLRYKGGNKEDSLGSGLSDLLRSTRDGRYSQIINHMLSKEFHPLPFRWSELEDGPGRKSEEKRDVTETGVNQVGQKRKRNQGHSGHSASGGKKGGGGFKKKNDFVKQKKMRKQ